MAEMTPRPRHRTHSSREALGLDGERVVPLSPLAVPDHEVQVLDTSGRTGSSNGGGGNVTRGSAAAGAGTSIKANKVMVVQEISGGRPELQSASRSVLRPQDFEEDHPLEGSSCAFRLPATGLNSAGD
jgi:hypothetical protein